VKAIIHIGAEKTGTTSIQQFCAMNRAHLADEGILYPVSLGASNHMRLTAYALNDDKIDDVRLTVGPSSRDQVDSYRDRLRGSLAAEIEQAGENSTLILSNEHLQSRLIEQEEVDRLRDFISPLVDRTQILIYIRRQDRVAVSYYSTRLKADLDLEGPLFPTCAADAPLPDYYDYDRMLRRYEATFGRENITVRIFEPAGATGWDLLRDFREQCDIPESNDYLIPSRENQSLSELGIRFLRRFNKQAPRFVEGRLNPYRAEIIDATGRCFSGPGPEVRRLDAEAFYRHFEEGNEAINSRYFPESTGPLFDEDFSVYDKVRNRQVTENDLIDLATYLWLDRSKVIADLLLENALLNFEISVKANPDGPLPSLPDLPPEGSLSPNLAMNYLGALLYGGAFKKAVEVSDRLLGDLGSKPVLFLVHGFALLALGNDAAFEAFREEHPLAPKLAASLLALKHVGLAENTRADWMDFFEEGDKFQSLVYKRCLSWLQA